MRCRTSWNAFKSKPKLVHSDNGTEFTSNAFQLLMEKEGDIKQVFGLPYKPTSQAIIECFNGTLKRAIFKHFTMSRSERWIDVLQQIVRGYNEAIHATTRHIPRELQAQESIEHSKTAAQNLRNAAERRLQSRVAFEPIEVGDFVRIASHVHPNQRKNSIFTKKLLPQEF